MAERSIIDQLDDAIAAMTEERQLDLTNLGPEASALARVAQGLIGLPRETFKAELQQQLIRRDSMSSPAHDMQSTQDQPAKKSGEAGYVKEPEMRRENRH